VQVNHGIVSEEWTDPTEVVRRGYDAVSERYRADDARPRQYGEWITELQSRLPAHARVLDAGCGCGVPIAQELAGAGHRVTGVDVSDVQIERATRLVPTARFVRADITTVRWPPGSFDAIVALYSLIHVPIEAQAGLIADFANWLDDDGILLLIAGSRAWTGAEAGWLGTQATMWWSHADAATYRDWITTSGLRILDEQYIPEGDNGHALFWAQRDSGPG
jgi:2-polyprenyl-3-methyl-5-hydroxy-6-metoxy-1,4-benzoquinol methylase